VDILRTFHFFFSVELVELYPAVMIPFARKTAAVRFSPKSKLDVGKQECFEHLSIPIAFSELAQNIFAPV
jgi:hypothetical protein